MNGPRRQVWRVNAVLRLGGTIGMAALCVWMVVDTSLEDWPAGIFPLIGAAGAWLALWRTRAVLNPDELVVVNFLRTRRIRYADVLGPAFGDRVVQLELTDGRVISVEAVGYSHSDLLRFRGRRTRGERFIDAVLAARDAAA